MAKDDSCSGATRSNEGDSQAVTLKATTLLALPAELRNIIWALVLGDTTFDVKCKVQIPWGTTITNITAQTNSLALLRTCRQIHSETRLLPFRLNKFRFSSEDAFKPWLSKFAKTQQAAITEVHLVTWKARHMVESRGFVPRRVGDVFPIEKFEGLRTLRVEVRYTGVVRECDKWSCDGSELEDTDCTEQEGRLRLRWAKRDPCLVVRAPKRTSLRPNSRNRATFVNTAWSHVLRSKFEARSLRRLKNGLLDVTRMSRKHLDAMRTNSKTPLLRLPPEVWNHIWEYALGGRVLDVVFERESVWFISNEEQEDRLVKANINKITKYFKEAKLDAHLVFEHLNNYIKMAEISQFEGGDSA
ncbi:DNA binding [Ascochyta rabiei]|uniref:DNA binding n=1 Tax=Didymella rabiei TaxID=5454 RepID=A0A163BPD4_DIDRA|nr:DNA binding [Ascochyta rabiei]